MAPLTSDRELSASWETLKDWEDWRAAVHGCKARDVTLQPNNTRKFSCLGQAGVTVFTFTGVQLRKRWQAWESQAGPTQKPGLLLSSSPNLGTNRQLQKQHLPGAVKPLVATCPSVTGSSPELGLGGAVILRLHTMTCSDLFVYISHSEHAFPLSCEEVVSLREGCLSQPRAVGRELREGGLFSISLPAGAFQKSAPLKFLSLGEA